MQRGPHHALMWREVFMRWVQSSKGWLSIQALTCEWVWHLAFFKKPSHAKNLVPVFHAWGLWLFWETWPPVTLHEEPHQIAWSLGKHDHHYLENEAHRWHDYLSILATCSIQVGPPAWRGQRMRNLASQRMGLPTWKFCKDFLWWQRLHGKLLPTQLGRQSRGIYPFIIPAVPHA